MITKIKPISDRKFIDKKQVQNNMWRILTHPFIRNMSVQNITLSSGDVQFILRNTNLEDPKCCSNGKLPVHYYFPLLSYINKIYGISGSTIPLEYKPFYTGFDIQLVIDDIILKHSANTFSNRIYNNFQFEEKNFPFSNRKYLSQDEVNFLISKYYRMQKSKNKKVKYLALTTNNFELQCMGGKNSLSDYIQAIKLVQHFTDPSKYNNQIQSNEDLNSFDAVLHIPTRTIQGYDIPSKLAEQLEIGLKINFQRKNKIYYLTAGILENTSRLVNNTNLDDIIHLKFRKIISLKYTVKTKFLQACIGFRAYKEPEKPTTIMDKVGYLL